MVLMLQEAHSKRRRTFAVTRHGDRIVRIRDRKLKFDLVIFPFSETEI